MITDDFKFDHDSELFVDEEADTIEGEVVVLLTAKARSIKKENNKYVFNGDWFFKPEYGHRNYEIKTTRNTILEDVKNNLKIALKPIEKQGSVKSIEIETQMNNQVSGRIDVYITVTQTGQEDVNYSYFVEVG